MASIYGLFDASGELRYIGKANNPSQRLLSHMRDARKRKKTPLHSWLLKHGYPEMRVLEADCVDWREAERRLITQHRAKGTRLLNLADGGDQPFCSREVRAENGRKNGLALMANPRRKAIRDAKAAVMRTLRSFERAGRTELAESVRNKMRQRAAERPDVFGDWANV